ncbi:MAG: endolytic transglycosylase MltG [Alphaproteobacteria bacterium]|jgi:UPF0755 protein|nr:endolytic transglycosylase MltG [Alphaproteobacteria bacterium]
MRDETLTQNTPNEPSPTEPATTQETPALKKKRHILPYFCLATVLLTFVAGCLFFVALFTPGPAQETKIVIIPRGSNIQQITERLDSNDLLVNKWLFRLSARLMAKDQIKAGEYEFPVGMNVLDLTKKLRDGKCVTRQVTVPEGTTSHEVVSLLQSIPVLTGEITQTPAEGAVQPETYHYSYGDERSAVLARMTKNLTSQLQEMWDKRDPSLLLKTPQEALILASIVEKETGFKAEERARVASVFLNRLKIGMPLQSDPTVIYALTNGQQSLGRSLLRRDLMIESPINTYQNAGLPPQPICNPGKAAIEAVLHPEKTDFLYFVADGTGGHAFAKSLSDHNDNVARWIRARKAANMP